MIAVHLLEAIEPTNATAHLTHDWQTIADQRPAATGPLVWAYRHPHDRVSIDTGRNAKRITTTQRRTDDGGFVLLAKIAGKGASR
jgi:hypothetical protein